MGSSRYKKLNLGIIEIQYMDGANVEEHAMMQRYEHAKSNLARYSNKTKFLKMFSLEAAKVIPDRSLDFIYIDARHDYCAVKLDLQAYWPKLKNNGILAGHDFFTNSEMLELEKQEIYPNKEKDWSLCEDGTRHNGSVKAAVIEFANDNNLKYAANFEGWIIRKVEITDSFLEYLQSFLSK